MTRLDSALQRSESRSVIEIQSRRGSVSQHTETKREVEQNGGRAIFKRASRFLSRDREEEGGGPASPIRHYERGHPLPANHSPERKATIPFRNRDLGLASIRRRSDNLSDEAISGLSPQRHMPYSNFRRGDSQSRASPRSGSPRSMNVSPHRRAVSQSSSHHRGSTTRGHRTSHTSSKHASGKCTPSRRRDSVVSRTASPLRSSGTNKYADLFSPSHKRSPSQSSYGHSLDSEKLYRNLKSIASSAESDASDDRHCWSKQLNTDMEVNGNHSSRNSGRNSRKSGGNSRNSRNAGCSTGYNSTGVSTPYRDYNNHGHSTPKIRSNHKSDRDGASPDASDKPSRSDSRQSQSSTHYPLSPTSQKQLHPSAFAKSQALVAETNKPVTDRSGSSIRRGLEAIILSENPTSESQPAVPEMTIEDYVILADIPRSKLYPEEEETIVVRRRPQSQSPRRDNQHRDVQYVDEREVSEERGRGRERERGRDRREKERRRLEKEMGGQSKTNSTASGHSQLDSLNYNKGLMDMLDEDEEWRQYWFVMADSGLRYYRDSEAEERDEADGEIYLHHCLRVEEFDADKNYGLQLHMRDGLVNLSTKTSRIRRNWINILRRRISFRDSTESVRSDRHPDNSDISDRESLIAPSRTSPSPPHQRNLGSDVTGPYHDEPDMTSSPFTIRREAGEGRDKDHERRLEDRTKWFQDGASDREGDDPWDKVDLKKGAVTSIVLSRLEVPDAPTGPDIERKWEDFEQTSFGELRSLSLLGSQTPRATNEPLQREVVFLRQQMEALRQGRVAAGVAGLCGPDASCALRLEQMEREHRERLREIHNEHERAGREMERDKRGLLQEDAQNTAQVMDALRKAHQEEMERLKGPSDPSIRQQLRECELDGLSEHYSQQREELNCIQNSTEERHGATQQKEREMERPFITGQRSGIVPLGSNERSTSELQMLLRGKESEVEYLHKEIVCLRKAVRTLTKENEALSERYKEVYMELSHLKGRSEREMNSLKRHLKLRNPGLDEECQSNCTDR
ncbi:zinc finger CCCH domain-containing protein 13-like [Xyrauchen texanus]|uniref:zinc finger CCCH domain-containing protein 13-like n=1 Tax=Xyrauchen texanus TaxID=154827 RepID=UPI0022425DED|nr:zinc finger CCCH domain-containing protein 13-like [Xyrauchen texanus]